MIKMTRAFSKCTTPSHKLTMLGLATLSSVLSKNKSLLWILVWMLKVRTKHTDQVPLCNKINWILLDLIIAPINQALITTIYQFSKTKRSKLWSRLDNRTLLSVESQSWTREITGPVVNSSSSGFNLLPDTFDPN